MVPLRDVRARASRARRTSHARTTLLATPHSPHGRTRVACSACRSLFLAGELADAHRASLEGHRHAPSDERLGGVFDTALAAAEAATPPAPASPPGLAQPGGASDSFEAVRAARGGFCREALTRDLAGGEAVFGAQPAVHRSRAPLLSRESCVAAIDAAEAYAVQHGGWTTSRHFEVPTTDLPMRTLTALRPWFDDALARVLLPAAAAAYPAAAPDATKLRVLDAFLVRYTANAQAGLPVHCDQALLSYTIALNEPSEYEGGGTWFKALGATLDATGAGHAVLFPGRLEHAGRTLAAAPNARLCVPHHCSRRAMLGARSHHEGASVRHRPVLGLRREQVGPARGLGLAKPHSVARGGRRSHAGEGRVVR